MPGVEPGWSMKVMPVMRDVAASVVLDRDSLTATVTRRDGVKATMDLSASPFEPSSSVRRVTYLPSEDQVRFTTMRGDEVVAELPPDGGAAPLDGRPVVYLDQKDWSLLANSVHEPSRVASVDREAARRLIELAEAGRVVLPMSSAHMTETCKWADRNRRYRLAVTITGLSRGWQMRSPLTMRTHELRRSLLSALRGTDPGPIDVFTLEPDALYPPDTAAEPGPPVGGFPADLAGALKAWKSASAMFDTMLDADAITPAEIPGWVRRQQEFTAKVAEQASSRSERDRMLDAYFLFDLTPELAEVLASESFEVDAVRHWLERHQDGEVSDMPSLGLFREVMRGRHLNSGTTWEANDLTDMMYLCCAAGYADHVVGERSTIAQIEQAAIRLGRTVSAHRRIRDVAPLLLEI